jgi:hypothetical protein
MSEKTAIKFRLNKIGDFWHSGLLANLQHLQICRLF